jgi:hypothetical protein
MLDDYTENRLARLEDDLRTTVEIYERRFHDLTQRMEALEARPTGFFTEAQPGLECPR